MKRLTLLMLCGFLHMHYALADEEPSTQPMAQDLSATQQWLEMQRSGTAASKQAQPQSGEVMDKVHKRYLKSFEKPIPEYYQRETSSAQ